MEEVRRRGEAHVLCECEALATPRHAYLGSSFLDPRDVRSLRPGAFRNFSTGTELPWCGIRLWDTGGRSKGLDISGSKALETNHYSILFHSILFYSILFYSILFYSILFYSILFYSILFYSMQLRTFTNFPLDHIILLINKQLCIVCFLHYFRKDYAVTKYLC
jgi:hypothetical protein